MLKNIHVETLNITLGVGHEILGLLIACVFLQKVRHWSRAKK